jgi:hypothetical protein
MYAFSRMRERTHWQVCKRKTTPAVYVSEDAQVSPPQEESTTFSEEEYNNNALPKQG